MQGDVIEYDTESAALVRRLCELCGLDPEVTTGRELDELDHRFAFPCKGGRKAASWRILVRQYAFLFWSS